MKRSLAVVAVALVVPLLAACDPAGPAPTPSPTSTASPTASATPSASPTPEPEAGPVFTVPATCADLIGATLAADFDSRGIVLFDSTNGEGIFPGGFDNQQNAGDPFGCLYGVPNADLNTFVLTVQPVTQDEHEGIVAVLDAGGYDVTTDGDIVTYTKLGAETGQPADQLVIHVLRPDSWITGWASFGGEQSRVRISGYLDVVAGNVYL